MPLDCSLISSFIVNLISINISDVSKDAHQSSGAKLNLHRCVVHQEPYGFSTHCLKCNPFLNQKHFVLQSDEQDLMVGMEGKDVTATAVAEFLDETPGNVWGIPHIDRMNLNDQQPQIELAQFLSRPVLIKTHVWNQTDSFKTTSSWDPWYLFFNSAPIKSKINNYSYISCTLKLKFIINASPFYAGAMCFTYCPLKAYCGENIIADAAGGELVLFSQRPKVWVFPQTCEGGEITLPFFYHKNWLDLTDSQDVKDMGSITPCLFAPLISANGTTGTSVVINVYAWAEDVKLHAPTTKLALQSDEFDYKPSQIASAVSKGASALSRIPLIGPYMKASSTVMSKFANFASSIGYTNVPNMKEVSYFKNTAFPHNSSCEVSVPTDRSCVDPKNELTLDPRTVGLDGTDELEIAYLASKETYIGTAVLSSTDPIDKLTLVARVTPELGFQNSAIDPVQYPPMGYLSTMFGAWRGDIIFRFKFICTRFHKGRVRITFDPTNDISIVVPDYTTVFNDVIDIGADQDIEVRVPYSQGTTFLRTSGNTNNYNFAGGALAPANDYANGLLTMRVVNPLSGPQATSSISVLVFARAAENIEFAFPDVRVNGTPTASNFQLQSQELQYPVTARQIICGNKATTGDPNKYLSHYGESIKSLRPLIHRLAHQYSLSSTLSNSNTHVLVNQYSNRRPLYGGFIPTNGLWVANKTLSAGTTSYNYVRTGFIQLISMMFVGERGSITHSFNLEQPTTAKCSSVQVKRYSGTLGTGSYNVSDTIPTANYNNGVSARAIMVGPFDPGNGVALTDSNTQPGICMNFPYYSRYNFQFVNPSNCVLGSNVDDSHIDNVVIHQVWLSPASQFVRTHHWLGMGPDYNYFFFRNCPSLYIYSLPTTSG
nr:MAG: capsid protein [Crogonang virus 161]